MEKPPKLSKTFEDMNKSIKSILIILEYIFYPNIRQIGTPETNEDVHESVKMILIFFHLN